jgi:hypothetical protein
VSIWRLRRERRLALFKAKVLHEEATWLEKSAANARNLRPYPNQFIEGYETAAGWIRFHAEHEEHRAVLLQAAINVSRETSQ